MRVLFLGGSAASVMENFGTVCALVGSEMKEASIFLTSYAHVFVGAISQ